MEDEEVLGSGRGGEVLVPASASTSSQVSTLHLGLLAEGSPVRPPPPSIGDMPPDLVS